MRRSSEKPDLWRDRVIELVDITSAGTSDG